MSGQGNVIKAVEPDGPLAGRVFPGERLISIAGNEIRDVLDYLFYGYGAHFTLVVEETGGSRRFIRVSKEEGEDLGLDFESYLMDKPWPCSNNCIFCFVDQLPRGLRDTLYFKDDDARMSFLTGNYITLTNLTERDLQRIIDLRISPINISVHATEPELRARILGNPEGGRGYELIRRLARHGIVMNCQIVCCPGVNDGEALSRTMKDLAALHPVVNSVSVVPVGLTKHRQGLERLEPFNALTAAETVDRVGDFGDVCLVRHGSRIFFCADELFLKAGRPIPDEDWYEDYPQLENGVGVLRNFQAEFAAALEKAEKSDVRRRVSVATGAAAAEFLQSVLLTAKEKYTNVEVGIHVILNDFFGHSVDVAGLITGSDLISQLRSKDLGEGLFIPGVMLRGGDGVFLDNVTVDDASRELGVPVTAVALDGSAVHDMIFGSAG